MVNFLRSGIFLIFLLLRSVSVSAFQSTQLSFLPAAKSQSKCQNGLRHRENALIGPVTLCTYYRPLTQLHLSSTDEDKLFDVRTTLALIGGQSALIGIAVLASLIFKTPNYGFGPGISFGASALGDGILKTMPLAVAAYLLDFMEKNVPALQDVTKATHRTVLALLGGKFKPVTALMVSLALGLAAGFGEEMIFRGILQYELESRTSQAFSLGSSALIFGLLHAVTPAYAFLATLAGVYFGWIYQAAGNLAVPIATHALYDVGALFYAHWTVSRMTEEEQTEISLWEPK
mmetsp:Transcript_17877/g.26445  ORF Transcript_17877/g.26445 Transcript_17877/m.26445 type:complete len:289 (+) Transcript_17877:86-952(+)